MNCGELRQVVERCWLSIRALLGEREHVVEVEFRRAGRRGQRRRCARRSRCGVVRARVGSPARRPPEPERDTSEPVTPRGPVPRRLPAATEDFAGCDNVLAVVTGILTRGPASTVPVSALDNSGDRQGDRVRTSVGDVGEVLGRRHGNQQERRVFRVRGVPGRYGQGQEGNSRRSGTLNRPEIFGRRFPGNPAERVNRRPSGNGLPVPGDSPRPLAPARPKEP